MSKIFNALKIINKYKYQIKISAIILLSLGTIFTYSYTLYQNHKLQKSLVTLSEISTKQHNLIEEKESQINKQKSEIEKLKQKETNLNNTITSFNKKYTDITDKYLKNRANSLNGRSGNREALNFSNDVKNLAVILKDAEVSHYTANSKPLDVTESEKKITQYFEKIPTIWPTSGNISSPFGSRNDPTNGEYEYHNGIDITAPMGQKIIATAKGRVIFSGLKDGYGNTIVIDHGNNISTLYAHTSKLLKRTGSIVAKGDVIALVGSTGKSTGSHLHFEVYVGANVVNPLKYIGSAK